MSWFVCALIWVALGAVLGFVGSLIKGGKMNTMGNIIVGIVGAVLGGLLASLLGVALGTLMNFVVAAIAAAILLLLGRMVIRD